MSSRIDIAYAAGLFEGEGTVYLSKRGQLGLRIAMTDPEPVQRIQSILGGRFYGPHARKPPRKSVYVWDLSGLTAAMAVFTQLRPFLSPRRIAQFDAAQARVRPPEERGRGARNRVKTSCPAGHPYDNSNTIVYRKRNGLLCRYCRTCRNAQRRAARAR